MERSIEGTTVKEDLLKGGDPEEDHTDITSSSTTGGEHGTGGSSSGGLVSSVCSDSTEDLISEHGDDEERRKEEEEQLKQEVEEEEEDGDNNNSNTQGIMPEKHSVAEDPADYLRQELYDRMRKEQDLFTWLQKAALDGIWYWDLENMELEWLSPEFKQLFGYADEEVPNTSAWWQENIYPEDKEKALAAFTSHVTQGTPYDQVVRYYHKNGSTVWVRCRGKADLNSDGKPIRMLGAHSDVTSLMQQLKHKEETLDLLCSTSLDGFWDWDMTSNSMILSKRWKESLGYTDEELDNTYDVWFSLLHPEDRCKAENAMKCHMDTGAPYSVVLRYCCKHGAYAYMLAQGVAQKQSLSGEWYRMFGTHTDVTNLERAKAEAKMADAAKTTFLATMSHEIRTPLNCVLGMAQVLLSTELTEEQHDCLTSLHSSGSHLLNLLSDILDFSQIESGKIQLAHEQFDVQTTVRDIVDTMRQEVNKKPNLTVTLETHIPPKTQLSGDSERTRQVVFNLLGNAIKFTHEGTVGVKLVPQDGGVCIEVNDTGPGMSPEHQTLIFQEFTQAHSEIRSRYGGSGLGLSICLKLVKMMKGTMSVESELGVGSTFRLWLPGLQQTQSQQQPTNHNVLLIDTLSHSKVECALKAANIPCTTCTEPDKIEKVFDPQVHDTIVVAAETSNDASVVDQQLCHLLHDHTTRIRRVLTVGKGKRSLLTAEVNCQGVVQSLVQYPTSDELWNAIQKEDPKPPVESPAKEQASSTTTQTENNKALAVVEENKVVRVLLVDDNRINQKVMGKMLSRFSDWKMDIQVANHGLEAVELASKHVFDIIFMDILMPVMDGIEATAKIRQLGIDTPIIALTASASISSRDECQAAGMNKFLTKPVKMEGIKTVIEESLKHSTKSDTTTNTNAATNNNNGTTTVWQSVFHSKVEC